jgi:hypothetical protein
MKAPTVRCAQVLAGEAGARIRAAGRIPPDDAHLLAALMPYAKRAMRAGRWLEWAVSQYALAATEAARTGDEAHAAAVRLADEWIARPPEPGTVAAEFEAIVSSQLADVDVDQAGEAQ